MQIIDKKYRLFGVINVIDLLVVVALLVGGLVVYRLLWGGTTAAVPTAKLKDIEYTIYCNPMREYRDGQIRVGDPVSTKTSGKTIGTVSAVTSRPTIGDVFNNNTNKIEQYNSTYSSDVFIKVKAKGEPTVTGVNIGDSQIRNQGLIAVVTPTFQFDTAIVTDLKIEGE